MARLVAYFRKAHLTIISEKMAERLAHTVRNMRQIDSGIMLGVTGSDVSALLPRRVVVALGEIPAVLGGRPVSASGRVLLRSCVSNNGMFAALAPAEPFSARIPPRHGALIDGRPVLWLAPAPAGAGGLEPALRRLKRPPYLVAELSWKETSADRTYAWGGLRGFAVDLPVVTVGPGLSPRDEGKLYERIWYKALKLEPRLVVVETWNGAADGVSETADRKRKYLDLS